MRVAVGLLLAVIGTGCSSPVEQTSRSTTSLSTTVSTAPPVTVPTTATSDVAESPATAGGFSPPRLRGRVALKDIGESSGLVASRIAPGLYWTHNDSGNDPLVYCITGTAGLCGVWEITDAKAQDWEDIAIGPGPTAGVAYLYIGDIGDNAIKRDSVTIYRVPEPKPSLNDGSSSGTPKVTSAAQAITLTYADGSHNAEALIVHPVTGDIYVITKEVGEAAVYKADGSGVLRRVTSMRLGSGDPVNGADISVDGQRVALSTFSGGWELALPARGALFDIIWSAPAARVDLGSRMQGESVAYRLDGQALLATSEGSPMPLWEAERR